MRYLVAGGAGFIGSNLCSTLINAGESVWCIDNLATGRLRNIEHLLNHPEFVFVEHDIISPLPDLAPVHVVLNLASPASPPGYERLALETMRVNSEGTMRLLNFAESCHAPLVYASTSEAYGDPLVHPQTEDYRGNVSSTGPRSMYDESKRYGEALVSLYARQQRVDGRIVRIFNTYGPNSDPCDGRLVPNLITQAIMGQPMTVYADGLQTRSLCYVDDLVDGLRRVARTPGACGQVINLGNPEEHTILEFAQIVGDLCGSSAGITFRPVAVGDDPQRRQPNASKAKSLLGWEPHIGLEEGLLRTIAYFRRELSEVGV